MTPEQRDELFGLANAVASYGARSGIDALLDYVDSLLAQARADEREACAKVCDERAEWLHSNMHALKAEQSETLAEAIRARKDGQ